MTEIVASLGVHGRPRCCRVPRDVQAAGPPPSLRSATTVLAATRGKGVDRMPAQAASCPRNALQNEGRAMSRLAKNRQPRVRRGADWASRAAWLLTGDVTPRTTSIKARSDRRIGGVAFRAIAFSSTHSRLAVMHQSIESGGGLAVPKQGAAGPHRGCRWTDSPVPNRGDKTLKTTNEVRRGNYHLRMVDAASRPGRKRT